MEVTKFAFDVYKDNHMMGYVHCALLCHTDTYCTSCTECPQVQYTPLHDINKSPEVYLIDKRWVRSRKLHQRRVAFFTFQNGRNELFKRTGTDSDLGLILFWEDLKWWSI